MIQETISRLRATLPEGVKLVAVSKFHPVEAIEEAYAAGQRCFGENHVQELVAKHEALPKDIEWHFIGHLQTNKVKYIAPFVHLIHAVDTPKLLAEIDRQATKQGRKIKVLLQLHVAQEETKFGFAPEELHAYLASGVWRELTGVDLCGLMCMASHTDDASRIANDFAQAHNFFLNAQKEFFADRPQFKECSWGMTDDYPIALTHGATIVRIGSMIFGPRNSPQK